MADVRPPSRAGDAHGERRGRHGGRGRGAGGADRGQLLLVGALALAVVFVALALLLNTAIYTGNLATRDAGVDAGPAIEYVSASRAAGADAVRSVNYRNNTSHDDLHAAFNSTVDRWDGLASHHRAVAGDVADVAVVGVTNGTRVQQDNASRNFTDETGNPDWTVASDSDLSGIRSMRLTVEESQLAGDRSNAFHVNVTSGGATRSVYVYDDGDPEVLVVDDGTELAPCSISSPADGTFVVDVSNESVEGTACPSLANVTDVGTGASVEYRRGDAAGGTYTTVLDDPDAANGASLGSPGAGEPYSTPAIYGAEFRVAYRTAELDYEARVGVVPR